MAGAARVLALALAATFGVIGVQGLATYSDGADLLRVAGLVDRNMPVSDELLERIARTGAVEAALASCLDDLSRAGVSVSLRRLEQAIAALRAGEKPAPGGAAEVARRGQAAEQAVDARLRCTPVDGNAWLQRALLLDLRFAPAAEVNDALARSFRLAPAEGWIIAMRARFAASRFEAGNDVVMAGLSGDLRRMAVHDPPSDVAAFYVAAGPRTRAVLAAHIRSLPARELARRQAVIGHIDRLGVAFPHVSAPASDGGAGDAGATGPARGLNEPLRRMRAGGRRRSAIDSMLPDRTRCGAWRAMPED